MREKTLKLVLATLLFALALATVSYGVAVVFAEGEAVPVVADLTASLPWVVAAWLFYSLLGLAASAISGEDFDAVRFGKTVLVMLVVAVLALALRIHPTEVITTYGVAVDQIVTGIVNTSPGLMLIFAIEKVWKIIVALKAKWEKAREGAGTGPGPPVAR